ncbi:MAG: class I SAM-dependent methyltransferase [Lentisphaeraceae bacterium]|nr:class I SAM-dependent methyltransferase [Lentisphaeraceae bacterium]
MSTKQELMDSIYDDDINAFIGFNYSHMGFWDQGNEKDFNLAQERSLEVLIEGLNITSSSVVLDIGGGQGGTACWLAQKFNCKIVIVDIVEAMCKEAKNKIVGKGLEHLISVVHSDIYEYESEQNFDYIISVEAIHHMPSLEKLYAKVSTLLKPNGLFSFSSYMSTIKNKTLRNTYLYLTVGDKNIPELAEYSSAVGTSPLQKLSSVELTAEVLPKSTEVLLRDHFAKIKEYHVKYFGYFVGLLLPIFLKYHGRVVRKNQLQLHLFQFKKTDV